MLDDSFLAERIRTLRIERDIGVLEARRLELREALEKAIAEAATLDDLRPVLLTLVRHAKF